MDQSVETTTDSHRLKLVGDGLKHQAEASLRAGEEQYRRLLALLPAAVYTCEAPSGVITFFNDHAATLWGRSPGLGQTDERFCGSFRLYRLDGEPLPHDETPMALAVREGRAFRNEEVVIERPDGTRITALVSIDPIFDESGRVVGAVNAFHDTTALKQAEETLRESERHFRAMIDALPVAVYTTDAHGCLTHYNPAAVALSGRVPELGTDQWCVSWKLYRPDGTPLPHDECPMAVALKEDRAVCGEEIIVERPDGRRLWAAPYPSPLHDAEGRLVGGINMLADITERKQAEEAIKEADRRKTEFLATLGHELRNPLAPIRTGLEAMKLVADDPAMMEEIRGTMERQVGQMVRLIDDLLDVARITRGKLELRTGQVTLADVVQSAVESARPLIDEAGHELTVTLPPRPVHLEADPTRLAQVFANLLNNAAKYTPEGGHIRLSAACGVRSVLNAECGVRSAEWAEKGGEPEESREQRAKSREPDPDSGSPPSALSSPPSSGIPHSAFRTQNTPHSALRTSSRFR